MSTRTATFDFPPVTASIPAARHVVGELLKVWGAPHDDQDAALLVTELVANVVDHAGGDNQFTVEVTLSGDWLRIGVTDGSAIRPVVQELSLESPRGRGLRLVQAIADRWGYEDHEGGKRVWFELRPAGL
jgi:anti-sigma regulatory factor (Ser/Thr protein kinase)